MHTNIIFGWLAIVLSFNVMASGNTADMHNEINHLLSHIENSHCQYERNGSLSSSKKAVAHIKKKYDHFQDEIDSAEKFIEMSADKSMMSGNPYMVICEGSQKIKSRDWLLMELNHYRDSQRVVGSR